ncbi:unnamed protein product [Rotaria sp. Silwood1]|nr:unnamed protein product [Rotaria sp. Silwood1]
MKYEAARNNVNAVESFTNSEHNAIPQSTEQLTFNQSNANLIKALRRTRIILIILIVIQIAFVLTYFIRDLIALISYLRYHENDRNNTYVRTYTGTVVASAAAFIYEFLFLLMVIKYVRIGILIFAWIGILHILCVVCLVIMLIIATVIGASMANSAAGGLIASIIIIILVGIASILSVSTHLSLHLT